MAANDQEEDWVEVGTYREAAAKVHNGLDGGGIGTASIRLSSFHLHTRHRLIFIGRIELALD